MWSHRSLVVPAGTAESAPVTDTIDLTHGVIVYIGVGFPKGCKQLVKARVYHGEHQIFPHNSDEAATWDGGIEGGQQHYRLVDEPYSVTVKAYSPSASVSHTVTVMVNELPVDVAEPWVPLTKILEKLQVIFGVSS